MLKGINEGVLIEITDYDKDIADLKEKLENKEFFKEKTDFIITKENKDYFPEIWKIVSKYNHNLYIIKESYREEQSKKIEKDNEEKTMIITKPNFRTAKGGDGKSGAAKISNDSVALRSGRKVEFEGNVVVIGDVNPGAEIIASGDIYVFGRAKGLLHAGKDGDKTRVILALSMEVNQLRIAGVYARSGEDKDKFKERVAEIAFLDEENNLILQEFKALG